MAQKKQIRLKVKKRKIRIKRIIGCTIILIILTLGIYYFSKLPIKNIYIIGNKIISDKEILDVSGIDDYPSFFRTTSIKIENKIKKNKYIKEVKVKKAFYNKVYIYITEKKILCIYKDKLFTEDGELLDNTYNLTSYPILISDISSVKERFESKFSLIEEAVLLKISEIEYAPNEVDKERFILKMNDGNLVYVTLNKIEKINKYNSIYSSLEGKKGIIYLDSGNYVDIKE